jgi:2-amino-4-hydroxy-6-hydroxymethyldihydropteridine diphosphokinase
MLVAIALGSNLGDRLGNLRAAAREMEARGAIVLRRSGIWETAPVPSDQPAYLNAAVTAETDSAPLELLATLKAIEHAFGRRPERRWGPRPIDLDILLYGDQRVDLPGLQLPHPRLLERAFVLAPLSDVWPGALPVLGVRTLDALAATGLDGARRVGWL